ncbi:hypothetical protein EVAR_25247_1 [Eumeta japonica]|uniref:Uncharacterized protein n=1 Tax=Eumeta variegata TaxID=151549 RepID=A0A4C1WI54_EUMVA|nr:hypothetical protein EVAR_25247_1 [Eumeta japonica]
MNQKVAPCTTNRARRRPPSVRRPYVQQHQSRPHALAVHCHHSFLFIIIVHDGCSRTPRVESGCIALLALVGVVSPVDAAPPKAPGRHRISLPRCSGGRPVVSSIVGAASNGGRS